jgi:O-antigen/teichoic acid export membrane protein
MGTLGKQSVWSFLSSYVGIVLGILNKLVLYPLFFKDDLEYWGLITTYVAYATILSSFTNFGMPRVLQRFLPGMKEGRERLLGFTFLVGIGGGVLVFIALLFGKSVISNFSSDTDPMLFEQYYHLMLILVLIMMLLEYFGALLIANFKSHLPIFLNSVTFRIGVSVTILITWVFNFSLVVFIYLFVSIYLLNMMIAFMYLRRLHALKFEFKIRFMGTRAYWSFGFFSVLVGSSGWVLNYMDAIFVSKYLAFAMVAMLDISKNLASLVHMPARAVVQASIPVVSKAWNENDRVTLERVYKKTAITEIVVGGLIFLFLWINIDFILSLFPLEDLGDIKYVVLFLCIGRLVDLMTGANSAIIGNSRHYKFGLYANLCLVVLAIGLNVLLIPRYGLIGAGIALGGAILLNNIMMVLYLWAKERMHPFTRAHLTFGVFFVVVLIVLKLPLPVSDVLAIVLRNVIFVGAAFWLVMVNKPVSELHFFIVQSLGRVQRIITRSQKD